MVATCKRLFHIMALAAALTATGCAGAPKDHPTLPQMKALGTAGFELKMADTPDKLERIKKLPQLRIAQVEHKGRQVYVFTDAEGCQCLYAGDENDYHRLIIQARQQKRDQRSGWAQDQSNQSTYYYKGEPVNWGDVTILTGTDVDLEDLRGRD